MFLVAKTVKITILKCRASSYQKFDIFNRNACMLRELHSTCQGKLILRFYFISFQQHFNLTFRVVDKKHWGICCKNHHGDHIVFSGHINKVSLICQGCVSCIRWCHNQQTEIMNCVLVSNKYTLKLTSVKRGLYKGENRPFQKSNFSFHLASVSVLLGLLVAFLLPHKLPCAQL